MSRPPTGIEYKTDTRITKVDVSSKTLTAESGETISYEKLIIATGARVSYAFFPTKSIRLLAFCAWQYSQKAPGGGGR
jgi:NAD(P)H-nitrite reductase large subunit